jgi:REP element-mobilizing transposase RayT
MPQTLHDSLRLELQNLQAAEPTNQYLTIERQRKIEQYLDNGYGSCSLAQPQIASIVIQSIEFLNTQGHRVQRWVIMPNHLHLLITVRSDTQLSIVIRSLKTWTARAANTALSTTGRFWYPEYFDRYIRSAQHFERVVYYIDQNPVKAGLVQSASDWQYGSASQLTPLRSESSRFTQQPAE